MGWAAPLVFEGHALTSDGGAQVTLASPRVTRRSVQAVTVGIASALFLPTASGSGVVRWKFSFATLGNDTRNRPGARHCVQLTGGAEAVERCVSLTEPGVRVSTSFQLADAHPSGRPDAGDDIVFVQHVHNSGTDASVLGPAAPGLEAAVFSYHNMSAFVAASSVAVRSWAPEPLDVTSPVFTLGESLPVNGTLTIYTRFRLDDAAVFGAALRYGVDVRGASAPGARGRPFRLSPAPDAVHVREPSVGFLAAAPARAPVSVGERIDATLRVRLPEGRLRAGASLRLVVAWTAGMYVRVDDTVWSAPASATASVGNVSVRHTASNTPLELPLVGDTGAYSRAQPLAVAYANVANTPDNVEGSSDTFDVQLAFLVPTQDTPLRVGDALEISARLLSGASDELVAVASLERVLAGPSLQVRVEHLLEGASAPWHLRMNCTVSHSAPSTADAHNVTLHTVLRGNLPYQRDEASVLDTPQSVPLLAVGDSLSTVVHLNLSTLPLDRRLCFSATLGYDRPSPAGHPDQTWARLTAAARQVQTEATCYQSPSATSVFAQPKFFMPVAFFLMIALLVVAALLRRARRGGHAKLSVSQPPPYIDGTLAAAAKGMTLQSTGAAGDGYLAVGIDAECDDPAMQVMVSLPHNSTLYAPVSAVLTGSVRRGYTVTNAFAGLMDAGELYRESHLRLADGLRVNANDVFELREGRLYLLHHMREAAGYVYEEYAHIPEAAYEALADVLGHLDVGPLYVTPVLRTASGEEVDLTVIYEYLDDGSPARAFLGDDHGGYAQAKVKLEDGTYASIDEIFDIDDYGVLRPRSGERAVLHSDGHYELASGGFAVEPVYARASRANTLLRQRSSSEDIYDMAQPGLTRLAEEDDEEEAVYDFALDATAAGRGAAYDAAARGEEPVYDMGGTAAAASDDDPIYDLGGGAAASAAATAAAEEEEPVYDLGGAVAVADAAAAADDADEPVYDMGAEGGDAADAEATYDLAGETSRTWQRASPAAEAPILTVDDDDVAVVEDIYAVANRPASSAGVSRMASTPSIANSGIYDVGLHHEEDIYGRRASTYSGLSWDDAATAEEAVYGRAVRLPSPPGRGHAEQVAAAPPQQQRPSAAVTANGPLGPAPPLRSPRLGRRDSMEWDASGTSWKGGVGGGMGGMAGGMAGGMGGPAGPAANLMPPMRSPRLNRMPSEKGQRRPAPPPPPPPPPPGAMVGGGAG